MCLAAAAEPVFPDVLGFLETLVHLAPLDVAGDVDVPLEALMDIGSVLLDSFEGLEDRGKDFVVDFDQVEGLLRDLFRDCGNACDGLADVPDFVDRQYLLVAEVFIAPPDALLHAEGVQLSAGRCDHAGHSRAFE